MERTITEHQHDELNKSIEITSHAEGIFGASDCYSLEYGKRGAGGARIVLLFQTGAMGEVGVNGLACEALIVVMLDRLRAFQDGPMRCAENAEVIHHLEQALVHCVRRSERRIAAGVKDTAQPLA